ncbi:hypothetical protein SBOR_9458 [Sclerotinia borealis F-4128]|uniref:F-box domain-containing protein n=1 Tax=Sclerotinia borealis (strain F-4128) TaxID=1432307 RepID=W9C351_SCLBF|nr:hypothetical protein SBOR_9458 [Sclerotinia borealis F-4128]
MWPPFSYITMPLPRPARKATAKAIKSKSPIKKKIVKANKKAPQPEAIKTVVTNPVDRIYKTLTLGNVDIEEGLWMVRKLGDGKYEAVNLNTVAFEDISSEENAVRMTSAPENLEIFKVSQKSLNDVTAKLDRAVFTASGKVFRFIKLPIELRYKIYDFALILPSGSTLFRSRYRGRHTPRLALGLLATCRFINTECMPFLWKNTYNMSAPTIKDFKFSKQTLIENVRHIKCAWSGYRSQDLLVFGMIASCTKLETLEIELTPNCVEAGPYNRHKVQYLHQEDSSIRKFSRSNGFDKLISLRDIKKVIVSRRWKMALSSFVTEEELKTFEKFLIEKLTTPVAVVPPMVFTPLSSTPTRRSTRLQKLKGFKPIKYVPDLISDDEEGFWNEDDYDEVDRNAM